MPSLMVRSDQPQLSGALDDAVKVASAARLVDWYASTSLNCISLRLSPWIRILVVDFSGKLRRTGAIPGLGKFRLVNTVSQALPVQTLTVKSAGKLPPGTSTRG